MLMCSTLCFMSEDKPVVTQKEMSGEGHGSGIKQAKSSA